MRFTTRSHDSSMRRLSDTDTRPGGVEEDGVLVPSLHQSDVSQIGNICHCREASHRSPRVERSATSGEATCES
jgi:hypothetical protein